MIMSNQSENENQQIMTPGEVRQLLLAEIDAVQQAIAEVSNEQLEEVVGGGWFTRCFTCRTPPSSPLHVSSPVVSSAPPPHPFEPKRQFNQFGGLDTVASLSEALKKPEAGGRKLGQTMSSLGRLQGR
jgi:hypothetical protein